MNRPTIGFAAFLIVAGIAGAFLPRALTTTNHTDRPNAPFRFTETIYQLGEARQNDSLDTIATLENQTNSQLTISRFLSSCSCTVVRDNLVGSRIATGGQFKVPLRIETGLLPVASSSIVVSAIDEQGIEHHAHCALSADVTPEFSVSDESVQINLRPTIDEWNANIYVTPVAKYDLAITSVQSTNPDFDIDTELSGGAWKITVSVDPAVLDSGKPIHSTVVSVNTNSERRPKFEIYASARGISTFKATPSSVVIDRNSPGARSLVTIATTRKIPFRLECVILECDALRCLYANDKFAVSHEIELEVIDLCDGEEATTAFVEILQAGSTDVQRIEIPVFVL